MWRVHGVSTENLVPRFYLLICSCWAELLADIEVPSDPSKKLEWGQESIAETTDVSTLESFLQLQQQGEMRLLLGCISASTSLCWASPEGWQPDSQLRDTHGLRGSGDEMQSLQTVSITPCHTLPITAHVKCTHKNRHWKAKTAPVSNLTICYLSLHCCAAFTFLVVISQADKTIFSNICFVIWFFFFLHI